MHADGQRSGQQHTKGNHHQRAGKGMRRWRWPCGRAMMSLPFCQQLALDRIERFLRRAIALPLMVISLVTLLAASWLIPSRQTCPAGPNAAAHNMSSASRAARCQPGPSVELDRTPMH
jgi:hypothetical protein